MPRWTVCTTDGCPELHQGSGKCPDCRAEADKRRGTARERGYNSSGHRQFRRAVLNRDPTCVVCQHAASTVADHWPVSRRDLTASGHDANDPDNGRGLCAKCHNRETATHQPGGWNQRA